MGNDPAPTFNTHAFASCEGIPAEYERLELDGVQSSESNAVRTIRGDESGDYAIVKQGADRVSVAA